MVQDGSGTEDGSPSTYGAIREALLTGTAVVVPFVVTVALIIFAFEFVYNWVDTFSDVILSAPGVPFSDAEWLVNTSLPFVLLAVVFVVGVVANRSQSAERAVEYFDAAVERIPGVGQVYESFREMSTVMLESGVENFQEVTLVEFPTDGVYALGFVTAEPPAAVVESTEHDELLTVFVPLAPNPVMGGHLVYVSRDRLVDVDMTVPEGVQTIVTMGVATSELDHEDGLDSDELERLTATQVRASAGDMYTADESDERGR